MNLNTYVLRIHDTNTGTFSVAAIDLMAGTALELATEIVIDELSPGLILERITDTATNESAELISTTAPKGFKS